MTVNENTCPPLGSVKFSKLNMGHSMLSEGASAEEGQATLNALKNAPLFETIAPPLTVEMILLVSEGGKEAGRMRRACVWLRSTVAFEMAIGPQVHVFWIEPSEGRSLPRRVEEEEEEETDPFKKFNFENLSLVEGCMEIPSILTSPEGRKVAVEEVEEESKIQGWTVG